MALDRDEINRAYLDFLRLSDTERFNVSGLGGHPTSRLSGGEYGNAELLFMSPVTVNYSWESLNSFGLAYIKSLAWNLIRNFFAYGMLYFMFSVVVIKTMINYFPSYLPFGIPENQETILNGIIAPLIIHAVWATT